MKGKGRSKKDLFLSAIVATPKASRATHRVKSDLILKYEVIIGEIERRQCLGGVWGLGRSYE